jgi:hypothetical protein
MCNWYEARSLLSKSLNTFKEPKIAATVAPVDSLRLRGDPLLREGASARQRFAERPLD